jgi:DNA-binding response OmpR family regulator
MRRVLVVDDEPHIRAVLRGYLEADGFAVSEAADGEDAVRQVRQDAPDLVLLDVMLPGIDGIEALRQVRTFSDVYVILVTARTEEVDKPVGLMLDCKINDPVMVTGSGRGKRRAQPRVDGRRSLAA